MEIIGELFGLFIEVIVGLSIPDDCGKTRISGVLRALMILSFSALIIGILCLIDGALKMGYIFTGSAIGLGAIYALLRRLVSKIKRDHEEVRNAR